MDPSPDIELVKATVEKFLQARRNEAATADAFVEQDDDEELLLSKLLSELESLKSSGTGATPMSTKNEITSQAGGNREDKEDKKNGEAVSTEEIVKEIKEVKRQNSKTHWLLSALIVLTVTWQLSEFSMLLKIKDGLSHPFRSLGGMVMKRLKGPREVVMDAEKLVQPSKEKNNSDREGFQVPSIQLPEMPQYLGMGTNGEK